MDYKKLVLFDIDGTLIAHAGTVTSALARYDLAIKAVYDVDSVFDIKKYNGFIERSIAWDLVRESGITRQEFLHKFPMYVANLHQSLVELSRDQALYVTIPDAVTLVEKLSLKEDIAMGVITGNAKRIGEWKLEATNLKTFFDFCLFGDEADDRNELAKLAFEKARVHFGQEFEPDQILVIGDTVHDIRCGQAIGATTIAVTTGLHVPPETLAAEGPDFLVDTLLDRRILTILGLV